VQILSEVILDTCAWLLCSSSILRKPHILPNKMLMKRSVRTCTRRNGFEFLGNRFAIGSCIQARSYVKRKANGCRS